jgi:hypothetical protein
VWQLYGNGSVGSQALVGIPVVAALCADPALRARSQVWPFTTGLTDDPTGGRADAIVHAEIWPASITFDGSLHTVRDAAQVLGLARQLDALDGSGALGACFAPPMPEALERTVVEEEGWILGGPLNTVTLTSAAQRSHVSTREQAARVHDDRRGGI